MTIIIDHNCNSSYIPNVLSGGTNSVFPPWLKTDVFLVGFVSSYLLSVGWLQSFPDARGYKTKPKSQLEHSDMSA